MRTMYLEKGWYNQVSEEKKVKTPRMPKLWEALLTMAFLVAMLALGIVKYGVDPHVPMFIGTLGAAMMALYLGYKWEAIEKAMMDGIYKALQSVCILIIVGILIGVWINAGVVPTMIYYGLKVLKPAIFFIAAVLICSITSLATGTSWGTMGTMGVALMGIGFGLGMNPGMTAGAVLSGAYFGDKMSPLSDTTNLAPAMAGTDVMTHVKGMILPTGITYGITLVAFGILGAMQYHGGDADMSRVTEFSGALESVFTINPLLLLPPVIVIVAVAMKMPAIPGITLGELFDKADEAETARLLDIFIDLQVKIMNTEAPTLLNKQRNKLAGMIGRVKEIDPSTRYDLQMRTDRMRGKHNICHGDFSPSNVIVGEDGNLYVCDWTHVTRGLDAADAATTYCILKSSRPALADAYLDAYSKKTDTPKQVIDYWVPVVAAAELARGREREHDILLTFIEGVADYE